MPAKRNPIHINAVPSLYQLGAHVNQMSRDAFTKPLTDEQRKELVKLAVAALLASGITEQEIEDALPTRSARVANGTSLKPAPASIPEPVAVVSNPGNEKKGGLFNR